MVNPFDIQGHFVLRIDESSFEPISESEKRDNYKGYVANVQAWAQASREQAKENGTTDGIVNIDYLGAIERLSELSGENSGALLLDAPVQQVVDETSGISATDQTVEALTPADGVDINSLQGMNSGFATPDEQPFFNASLPTLAGV